MSTEHQKYSTENQGEIIRLYAEQRGFTLVQTYEDSGKSGLRLDGRDALKRLIDDVRNGTADFSAILVYDVSRWGRFQDADESAYYEFICKEAGITVTDLGRLWTRGTVHQVLTNEKYIGNNVYNRISFKLKKKRVANPPDTWIRASGAFAPIVDGS